MLDYDFLLSLAIAAPLTHRHLGRGRTTCPPWTSTPQHSSGNCPLSSRHAPPPLLYHTVMLYDRDTLQYRVACQYQEFSIMLNDHFFVQQRNPKAAGSLRRGAKETECHCSPCTIHRVIMTRTFDC